MIRISSNATNIGIIQSYVDEVFEKYNLNKSLYADILTSLTEAVNNAIIHGNQLDENKFVQIGLRCRPRVPFIR